MSRSSKKSIYHFMYNIRIVVLTKYYNSFDDDWNSNQSGIGMACSTINVLNGPFYDKLDELVVITEDADRCRNDWDQMSRFLNFPRKYFLRLLHVFRGNFQPKLVTLLGTFLFLKYVFRPHKEIPSCSSPDSKRRGL
jgi:hypothetical protein